MEEVARRAGFLMPVSIQSSDALRRHMDVTGKRKASGDAKPLASGVYSLDDPPRCDAFVQYASAAIDVSATLFEELWNYSDRIDKMPNPMNPTTFLKRKVGTFGTRYKYGGQLSLGIPGPEANWPTAVQLALADARARSSKPETLTAVHTNWYPDGSAGLQPHADDEDLFLPSMPIYSYTLLSDPTLPRGFQIYRKSGDKAKEKAPLYDLPLGHGDLLVMAGDMQTRYKHGVKATSAKAYSSLRRINMTVRSVDPEKLVA